jgi:hypothetical protein
MLYLRRLKKIILFPIGLLSVFSMKEFINFFKIKRLYALKYNKFLEYSSSIGLNFYPVGTYEWDRWRKELGLKFSQNLPIYFLHNKLISGTMVLGATVNQKNKLKVIQKNYKPELIKKMLKESAIGCPKISNFNYLTSENSIHQSFHLSSYKQYTTKDIADSQTIVEWGGGYGCLARIVKNINPTCTYIIMDLPELNALQYVYLSSIFGTESISYNCNQYEIQTGKINLISSDFIMFLNKSIKVDSFISNWALTESGLDYQSYVKENNFFEADNILIGCIDDENNHIILNHEESFNCKHPIMELGARNYYLIK